MEKKLKIEKGLLDRLTSLTNRSKAQTQELFELCDFNFEKLLTVERKIKNNFVFWCPGDKEAVDYVLGLKDETDYFKLDWLLCRPMCRPKPSKSLLVEKNIPIKLTENDIKKIVEEIREVGRVQSESISLIGLITKELKESICSHCGYRKFKDQWGISWNDKLLCSWIQNKNPLPNLMLLDHIMKREKNCYGIGIIS